MRKQNIIISPSISPSISLSILFGGIWFYATKDSEELYLYEIGEDACYKMDATLIEVNKLGNQIEIKCEKTYER